jgi:hypothetical protein
MDIFIAALAFIVRVSCVPEIWLFVQKVAHILPPRLEKSKGGNLQPIVNHGASLKLFCETRSRFHRQNRYDPLGLDTKLALSVQTPASLVGRL